MRDIERKLRWEVENIDEGMRNDEERKIGMSKDKKDDEEVNFDEEGSREWKEEEEGGEKEN